MKKEELIKMKEDLQADLKKLATQFEEVLTNIKKTEGALQLNDIYIARLEALEKPEVVEAEPIKE